MRRGVIGFVLLGSLAAIGSQFAHSLAYRLVVSDADARVRTVAAAQHRYLEYAPLGLAVCSAVIVLGFAAQVRAHVRRSPGVGRPAPVAYALFAPLLFCFQELLERLAAQGGGSWATMLTERVFWVGLALQVPVGVLAYVLARALLRVAAATGSYLRARGRVRLAPAPVLSWLAVDGPPRLPALALGYATRGPPLRSR